MGLKLIRAKSFSRMVSGHFNRLLLSVVTKVVAIVIAMGLSSCGPGLRQRSVDPAMSPQGENRESAGGDKGFHRKPRFEDPSANSKTAGQEPISHIKTSDKITDKASDKSGEAERKAEESPQPGFPFGVPNKPGTQDSTTSPSASPATFPAASISSHLNSGDDEDSLTPETPEKRSARLRELKDPVGPTRGGGAAQNTDLRRLHHEMKAKEDFKKEKSQRVIEDGSLQHPAHVTEEDGHMAAAPEDAFKLIDGQGFIREPQPVELAPMGEIEKTQGAHLSFYFTPVFNEGSSSHCSSNGGLRVPFLVASGSGKASTRLGVSTQFEVCRSTYKGCLMQGSCFIQKDQNRILYNIKRVSRGEQPAIFQKVTGSCVYGFGTTSSDGKSICLDPFYSVAADPNFHRPGAVLFFPEFRGIDLGLESGRKHDGYFVVRDSGSRIVGQNRFDVFTGTVIYSAKENPFADFQRRLQTGDRESRRRLRRYQVIKAGSALAELVLKKRNYPLLPTKNSTSKGQ